jgi:predicted secreted hydrolase
VSALLLGVFGIMAPRFLSESASDALAAAVRETASAGVSNGTAPVPIPPSRSAIDLPADHYLHRTAPTEWWWNIGTLRSGERTFGFEINAASFEGQGGFAFTQVMLTDVANDRHFQRTTPFLPPLMFDGNTWAEYDPTKDWSVRLGDPNNALSAIEIVDGGSGYTSAPSVEISGGGGVLALALAVKPGADGTVKTIVLVSGGLGFTSVPTVTITGGGGSGATARAVHSYVTMNAAWGNPTKNMAVKAGFPDEQTQTEVQFDLTLSQQGPPFIVNGTGVNPVPGTSGGHLQTNNYYYSLTRLQASGTVSVAGETFPVTGVTWMDHEYGAFTQNGHSVKWILQDMQLNNGVCVSNFTIPGGQTPPPALNVRGPSHATVQRADGTTYYVDSFVTPFGRTWTNPDGDTFFLELLVEIPSFDATLTVTTLIDAQEFRGVYEGIASAAGSFEGIPVSGDAWNEQTAR